MENMTEERKACSGKRKAHHC